MSKIIYKPNALNHEIYKFLRNSVMPFTIPDALLAKAINQSLYNIVAFHNNIPVAMGRVAGDGVLYFYLQDICVLPSYQSNGIGTNIVNLLLQHIKEKSHSNIHVSIGLISAKNKESFYQKFGFSKLPNEESDSGMRLIFTK